MKPKVFFLMIVLSVLQSGFIYTAEGQQTKQGWIEWAKGRASSAYAAAQRGVAQAATTTKKTFASLSSAPVNEPASSQRPSRGWQEASMNPDLRAYLSMTGAAALLKSLDLLADAVGIPVKNIFTLLPRSDFGLLGVSAIIGTLSFAAVHKIVGFLDTEKISEPEAIERIKKSLQFYISDKDAYPTLQSQIDALKNPNALLVFDESENALIYRACTQIINQLETRQLQEKQSDSDKRIDEYMKKYQYLAQTRIQGNPLVDFDKMDPMRYHPKLVDELKAYNAVKNQSIKQKVITAEWGKNTKLAAQQRTQQQAAGYRVGDALKKDIARLKYLIIPQYEGRLRRNEPGDTVKSWEIEEMKKKLAAYQKHLKAVLEGEEKESDAMSILRKEFTR